MLTIRLQRVGKKKFPTYRLIVSEKSRDTRGTYLEQLGSYNPQAKAPLPMFQPRLERVKYWLSKGAQTSDTVHNFLVSAGVITGAKRRSVFLSAKRQAKLAAQKPGAAAAGATPAAALVPAA